MSINTLLLYAVVKYVILLFRQMSRSKVFHKTTTYETWPHTQANWVGMEVPAVYNGI